MKISKFFEISKIPIEISIENFEISKILMKIFENRDRKFLTSKKYIFRPDFFYGNRQFFLQTASEIELT